MTKKQPTPLKDSAPNWKRLPKEKLSGINFTKRSYFDKGVSDAMEGRTPPSPNYLKGKTNCFILCYRDGYLTTKKILEENK